MLTQESLAQIGIKTTINKIPGANWRTELNKKVLPLYTNVFSGWLDYPEYFFIWCYHGKNSIFNTMSYQSKALDTLIDGAVDAAAVGDTANYDKDVKGLSTSPIADMPRIPLFQPYSNVAMQKNVSRLPVLVPPPARLSRAGEGLSVDARARPRAAQSPRFLLTAGKGREGAQAPTPGMAPPPPLAILQRGGDSERETHAEHDRRSA